MYKQGIFLVLVVAIALPVAMPASPLWGSTCQRQPGFVAMGFVLGWFRSYRARDVSFRAGFTVVGLTTSGMGWIHHP